ncbi:MAG: choice-of-anchor D domain-containing protein, partial [bacterium]
IVSTNSFTVVSTAAPDVNLNPASVDFGTVTIGSSVTVSSQIQNLGTADLNVTGITRCTGTSAEFTWSPALPLTVSAGGSQTLSLAYSPVEVGSDNGCLEITSNDPVTPTVTLSLSGTGVTQPTPAAVDLDISRFSASKRVSLKRGTLVALKLVVTNAGTADGTASATLVGTQNGIEVYNQTDTLSIPAGSSLTYRFPTYQPTAAGEITWTVTIADEDPDADIASAVTRVVP